MKKIPMVQCTLSFGNYTEVAWIHKKFAILHKNLEIDVDNGKLEIDEDTGEIVKERKKCYVSAVGTCMELTPDELAKMHKNGLDWKSTTDY